jgi:hypothetical protein
MKHIEAITRNDNFIDRWRIIFDWGDTITASDDPDHPQTGVASEYTGKHFDLDDEPASWEDLPETLKTFVKSYIAEHCEHKNVKVVQTFPETGETFYKCLECGTIIDDYGNTVIGYSEEIPF